VNEANKARRKSYVKERSKECGKKVQIAKQIFREEKAAR
jgi:hypothetical protein